MWPRIRKGTIEDLTFDNVSINLDRWTDHPGGYFDHRPCAMEPEKRNLPTLGFHMDSTANLTMRHCSVS